MSYSGMHEGLHRLGYERDSSALLQRLAKLPGAAFLDSGLGEQHNARYDILSALPAITLTQIGDEVVMADHTAGTVTTQDISNGTLLDVLRAQMQALQLPTTAQTRLPFTGGAIGYLSYAARRDLVAFKAQPAAGRTPLAGVGIYLWAIVVDHQARESWLSILPGCSEATRQAIKRALSEAATPADDFHLLQPFSAQWQQQDYLQAFDRLQQWILAGDCYQANLSQRFSSRYRGHPLTAYLQLRRISQSPFSAYLALPQGAMLSLSPERFIRVQDGHALTQPIKGTRARSSDPVADAAQASALLASDKDRAENLMIVDLLRNDFGSLCETGSVRTDALFELHSFSAVHHLVSSISGRLPPGRDALALLYACFPGGSITGAPKIRAMQIIDELESVPRSVYCGSVFWCNFDGNLDSSITIRTLLCEDGEIHCWGGGGIVADSAARQEYQESIDKVSALINTLQQHFLARSP